MTALPSFDEFFTALHDKPPFPWQRRLARDVMEVGWPEILDLPTGVGKTSALDVALYCLAAAPQRMPRRTVLVVDRRIVVDQGAEHAAGARDALTAATAGPLAAVAARLRALWDGPADEPPFAVAVMRGGMPRDNDWARRPDQPVLGVSTVDQLGSRLLFRGYGVSPRSASVHAGLLGNDTLILLDEVHLANAFAQTLEAVKRFRCASSALPDRFVVTQMSATVRSTSEGTRVFGLDDSDRAHPILARRLQASKRVILQTVKVTGDDEPAKVDVFAARTVEEALALQARGARVVAIVVNRVDTARVARRLLEPRGDTDALLVTGRMRAIERDHVVKTVLLPRAGAGRTRSPDQRPLIVVATQCIEAGADLDFDAMVTECASLDALRQRFGRVDRRGELATSTSVVLGRSDQLVEGNEDPIYGKALASTWSWLVEHATGGEIDLGVSSLPEVRDAPGHPRDDLLAPAAEAPVLLPAHLDLWAQTSQLPVADPEVATWLHGSVAPSADVQVIWRANNDVTALEGQALNERIEYLQSCRPSSLEAITIPLSAARRWLQAVDIASAGAIADIEGKDTAPMTRPMREAGERVAVLRWRGDDSDVVRRLDDLRPGDVLVLDAARGGLGDSSFNPSSETAVVDLGDLAQLRGRGIATLRLDRDALAVWLLPDDMLDAMPEELKDEPEELEARVDAWLGLWPEEPSQRFLGEPREWRAARSALQSSRRRISAIGGRLIVTATTKLPPTLDDAVTEDDDSSFRQVKVTLTAHSAHVRDLAGRYARAIGLDGAIVSDLALAAWMHDVGKADPRFQRWLVGGSEVRAALLDDLLAKSELPPGNAAQRRIARQRAGYPARYRHELLSLAMIQGHDSVLQEAHDRDLVLHLIASHHGWCRPFPPPISDQDDLDVQMQHGGHQLRSSTRHELARLDSGIASRFWRLIGRYGWWGLAWLEAVMRLADHRASEQETGGQQETGGR
jgi:CRISPR-associated endonuclease/helicase Cas3